LARLALQTDQHIRLASEPLHALLADMLGRERRPDLAEIGRAGGADLHDDAAAEINPEIEARMEEQHDRSSGQDRRDDEAGDPPAHKVDAGAVRNEAEQGANKHGAQTGRTCGRLATYQRETRSRVSI